MYQDIVMIIVIILYLLLCVHLAQMLCVLAVFIWGVLVVLPLKQWRAVCRSEGRAPEAKAHGGDPAPTGEKRDSERSGGRPPSALDDDAWLARELSLAYELGLKARASQRKIEKAASYKLAARLAKEERDHLCARAAQLHEDETFALELAAADAARQEQFGSEQLIEALAGVDDPGTRNLVPVPAEQLDGVILMDDRSFLIQECGASYGGHSNLCGYLSLTYGDGPGAVALKLGLSRAANCAARELGVVVDYAAPSVALDSLVLQAFAQQGTETYVYYGDKGIAMKACSNRPCDRREYLYLEHGHYRRLKPLY
jgi:hypothetical protein